MPNSPSCTASMACMPNRVASTRSNAVGRAAALDVAEHRAAGLLAGPLLDLGGQHLPDAAEPHVAERVQPLVRQRPGPPLGRAGALGHDHDRRVPGLEPVLHVRADLAPMSERLLRDEDHVRAAGRVPACSAIQPACRPITSTISARWWLSAVVCSRSIASIAMFTAVSKPNV